MALRTLAGNLALGQIIRQGRRIKQKSREGLVPSLLWLFTDGQVFENLSVFASYSTSSVFSVCGSKMCMLSMLNSTSIDSPACVRVRGSTRAMNDFFPLSR